MRDDEECAKEKLLALLTVDFGPIEVRPGDEPPDYVFCIQGREYAVEVTSLHNKAEQRGKTVSRHGQEMTVQRWVESVERRALKDGTLKGAYVVAVFGDLTAMSDIKAEAGRHLCDFLDASRTLDKVEYQQVYKARGMIIGISKYRLGLDRLFWTTSVAEWEGESQEKANRILREVLDEKRDKLSDVGLPCILIFHNWYPFAHPADYAEALSRSGDTLFYGIYLIDEGNCTPLRPLSLLSE